MSAYELARSDWFTSRAYITTSFAVYFEAWLIDNLHLALRAQ